MAIDLDVHGNTKPLEAAVQAAINRIRRQPIKITVDDKGATQPLGNMKRAADEFSKSMEAANARILAFGASMAIINGVADAFKGMVRNLVEVEKSLADINVVMGLSTQNLDKFGDGLFKVAKETGAAFRVAADAATEYARQGLAVEETLKRTRDALVLTRLTGMDSAEAVKSLTAAMNTYGNQIKDTTQLVSKFAAVDVQFAVSAEDFAAAISRTGQAAKSAGVDIDELIGIVTSAQQQTARGGAVIGNALKTIFTKTGRTDTLNQLENLGIAVRDLEGNTIGAKRILSDLANTFDTLSEAQKAQITQTMGGLFHINILKAVLSDAAKQNGILANATQISSNATDEAIQKNEQLRQTMDAMASETGNAIKQLSVQIGELMLAPGMEKILNAVKSIAEGASDILGDGESTGNKFATGFLRGLGNIITGPGLVVLTTVFVKLFMTAAKFTKESLSSLMGVTNEAQKQKAIQTSLVALIGQNAALGKEMLRTDISRTEKEKILLGLLQMQTAEANKLNTISKQLAATLYTRGYGPGLTTGKRRAYGHIPNFADPERAQAAKGGYAAGSIRTMNMPGEGSVIYNSAETVKNFAGFKQPAIMPPQSSKAGKNYQQAFGSIHGFDPYAAGGYIPNFARGGKGVGAKPRIDLSNPAIMAEIDKKTRYLNADSNKYIGLSASLGPDKPKQTFYVAGGSGTDSGIFNQKGRSFYKKAAMQRAQPRKIDVEFKSLDEKDERRGFERYDDEINSKLQKRSAIIASGMLKTFGYGSMNSAAIEKDLPKSKMATVAGHIFEAVTKSVLRAVGAEASIPDGPTELIDLKYNKELYELFGVPTGKGSSGAEAKINTNLKNVMSFARKIYSSDPTTKTPLDLKSLPAKKGKAYGHIPNFADPLSDAIGREKAAGVPVSQIRVGSHSALMSKGNPLGLGVTNTHDEPNGLRDVFGANGFVPNYAFGDNVSRKISSLLNKLVSSSESILSHSKKRELVEMSIGKGVERRSIFSAQETAEHLKQQGFTKQETQEAMKQLNFEKLETREAMVQAGFKQGGLSGFNQKVGGSAFGKFMSGGGGTGAMMGLSMIGGMLPGAGTPGTAGYAANSAMSYASTGMMVGSMAGPFAPLAMAVGAVTGAIYGLSQASEEATKALKEEKEQRLKIQTQTIGQGLNQVMQGEELVASLSKAGISQQAQQILGLSGESTVLQGFNKLASKSGNVLPGNLGSLIQEFKGGKKYYTESELENMVTENLRRGERGGKQYMHFRDKTRGGVLGIMAQNDPQVKASLEYQRLSKEYMGTELGKEAPYDYEVLSKYDFERGQQKVARSELVDYIMQNQKQESFAFKFGEGDTKYLSKEQYASLLKGEKIKLTEKQGGGERQLDEEAMRAALLSEGNKIEAEYNNKKTEQKQAIILQLNLQKAQIQAQKAAADAQLDIKSKFLSQSNMLDTQEKLMGGLMTEQQKAQMQYNKSLLKASEAYESGAAQARAALKEGILQDITQNPALQNALKQELFKGEDASGKTLMDLTSKLSTTDAKELEAILKRIGETHTEANEILTNRGLIYDNQLDTLKKQQSLTKEQASNELKINQILADRKQLLEDMTSRMKDFNDESDFLEKEAALDRRILDAQRAGTGRYVSKSEQLSRDRAKMQEDIIPALKRQGISGKKGILSEYAGKLNIGGFSAEEESQILAMGRDADISEIVKAKKAREFEEANRGGKMQQLTNQLNQFAPLSNERFEELTGSSRESVKAQLESLVELDKARTGRNKDLNEEVERGNRALKRQNILNEKNVDAVKAEQKAREDIESGRGFASGFRSSMDSMQDRIKDIDEQLGRDIPFAFADGLANAMTEALNGTKNIKDALTDAAISFLGMIQKAMMQKAAYSIVGAMGFSRGGNVRNYSRGGGVPAMVSNGEYVMGRDAVAKYGGSFMHGLNAGGKIPGYSNGGKLADQLVNVRREKVHVPGGAQPGSALASGFGGGRGHASGRAYQSRAMSGFFYSQSGNVGLGEDTSTMMGILQEEERKRQEAEARRQAKKARRRQLIGSLVGIAAGAALSHFASKGPLTGTAKAAGYGANTPAGVNMAIDSNGMAVSTLPGADLTGSGFTNVTSTRSWNPMSWNSPSTINPALGPFFWNQGGGEKMYAPTRPGSVGAWFHDPNNKYGGPFRKYASGGYISGKSGIDQIPAMLSEGEYVIRASSARQLGKPMLDRINAGKFNEGGAVSELMGSSETAASGGNTNNINISINMERGSGSKKENQSQDNSGQNPADRSSDEQNNAQLAERIKQQVVAVIVEEQRPGGLLSE